MVRARTNQKPKRKRTRKTREWLEATRAEGLRGGGSLRPLIHTLDGDGGILAPSPSFFSPDVQDQLARQRGANGTAKYDPISLRGASGGAFTGQSIVRFALSLSDREETTRPFEENFVVRSGLRAFANGMVSLPQQLWDGPPSEDTSEQILDHPLLDLLNHPNRSQSGGQLVNSHTIDYKHDGEVFWFLMNQAGEPVKVSESSGLITEFPSQLLAVRGGRVQHKVDESGFPDRFRYGIVGGGWSKSFPWQAVIQFMEYDPYNFIRGLGDVQSLMREIDLMFQAYRYLDATVKNGGDPGGFITFEESVGQDELERRQAMVDDTYTVENAGRYKVLDRKAKFTPNPTTPKDMEYMSLFEWCLKAICAGIGVPPPVIGWYDDATYNNLDGARRELWAGANGVLSHAAGRQDVLRTKLIARLDGTPEMRGQADDIWPFYNPSKIEVLKKDRTDQLLKAAQVAASGVGVSYNEALSQAELDVEPADAGDQAYIDNKLREAGEPSTVAVSMASAKAGSPSTKARVSAALDALGRRWIPMPCRALPDDADPLLKKRALDWLKRYEKNIIARLGVYANGGRKPSARTYDSDIYIPRIDPSKLTHKDVAALVLNEELWIASLERTTKIPIKGIWIEGLKAARDAVGGPFTAVTDPRVLKLIASQMLELSEGVTSATSKRVRSAIIRILSGLDESMSLREAIKQSLPELTKELRAVFGTKDARALAISITETNRATQGANFLQMGEAKVSKKRWRTRSSDPRQSHLDAAAAGEINFNAKFPNGLKHPHAPGAPAKEVVNCVCVLEAAKFEDDLNPED